MGITTSCIECKQKMVDSVLEHTKECSARLSKSQTGTGMIPPSMGITFDTLEEQKKFMDNLKTGASNPPAPQVER